MESAMSNTIAWLIPASGNRWAAQATRMPENAAKRIDLSPCFDSTAGEIDQDDDLSSSEKENDTVLTKKPAHSALCLSFDQKKLKGIRGFVIGTDPKLCDIVLPRVRGISRRHCHITFDSEKRLVLRDTSKLGTTVWYDGNSNGTRHHDTWLLTSGFSYGFPSMVNRIVFDIQGIRFQVINNICLPQLDTYQDQVDDFLSAVAPTVHLGHRPSLVPAPLSIQKPAFVKHSVVQQEGSPEETYLWNTAKPWEPLVKMEQD